MLQLIIGMVLTSLYSFYTLKERRKSLKRAEIKIKR